MTNDRTRRRLRFSLAVALGAPLTLWAGAVTAGGPVQGAKAAGMGTAFVGVADDPSAIFHNPAGLAQQPGTSIYLGAAAVRPESRFEDGRENEKTRPQTFFPPHLFVASDLGSKTLSLGLGLYAPFGIGGRKWEEGGLTRYASTENSVGTFAVNPTGCWRVTDMVALAVGVDYMRAENRSRRMLDQSAAGAEDGRLTMDVAGNGWGYNLGALFTVEPFQLGFAYRSRVHVPARGEVQVQKIAAPLQGAFGGERFETGVSTTFHFPDIYSLGLAWSRGAWTLALEAERVRWSAFDELTADLETEVPAAGFTDQTTKLGWKDSWQLKAGADWKVSGALSLRAGYAYLESPVPELALEPGNPDANQHNFCFGLGYRTGRLVFDAFYIAGFSEPRSVRNPILSGRYESSSQYAGLSAGYRF